MKTGRTANAARKITMLICAVAVVPIIFAQFVSQLWTAVAIIGLAAAHQAWSANLMTLPSDMFPPGRLSRQHRRHGGGRRRHKMKKLVIVILNPVRNNSHTEAARPAWATGD
jgi:hypothetical protein